MVQTNSATDLQQIPTVPAATQRLTDLFDALEAHGYSMTDLFEASSPGATDALKAWAAMRDLKVTERSVTPPGCPETFIAVAQVMHGNVYGARIAIHRIAAVLS